MPIVNIDLAWLNRLLGKPYETETLRESLEQIGCDVEDVVDIQRSRCPQCGSLVEHPLGQDEVKACRSAATNPKHRSAAAGHQPVMRLDLLADRPDLFDVGGLARALRGTLGIESGLPKYDVKPVRRSRSPSINPPPTNPASARSSCVRRDDAAARRRDEPHCDHEAARKLALGCRPRSQTSVDRRVRS